MYYSTPTTISTSIGNNAFAYDERVAAFGKAEIVVSGLIDGTIDDVQIGDGVAFAEMHSGEPKLFYGLKNLIHIP